MRRLVVAVFVVALALAMAGCSSGGSSSASTSATPASTSAAPAAAPGSTTLPDIVNKSENETTTFIPFPTTPDVPAELQQKVTVEKQPTIIYFFDSTQQVSKEVRNIIDAVRNDNRGSVDLVAYDIGKYLTTAPDGTITVDDALINDPAAKAAVTFARNKDINVTFTPFIVLTDGQGYIIYKHRGLVDQAFLEREVLRASR